MELKFQYYDGMLQKIINHAGYLSFSYYQNGAIKSIAASGGESVSYEYTDGLLTGFTNMASNKTTYAYDKKNRLSKVISPEQVPLLELVYDDSNRVTEKKVSGSRYQYVYDDKNRTIQCTEPNGNQTLFRYTKDYRLESEESSDGTVTYQYPGKTKAAVDTDKKTVRKDEIVTASVSEREVEPILSVPAVTDQVRLATGPSVTASPTPPEDNTGQILKLETYNVSSVSGEGKNNTIYPQYKIQNVSKESISISDLTIRYYYTIDGRVPQKFWCDWAGVQNGDIMSHITDKVSGTFATLTTPFAGADTYVETSFQEGAGRIDAGETLEIHTRFAKEGWQDYLPGDDYSQNSLGSFSEFDQVDVYYKGKLVWGKAHGEGTPSTPTPAPTGTPKPTPSKTPSPEGTPSAPIPTVSVKKNQLKLSMYNAGNGESSTNSIHPMMMLSNSGSNMVPLEEVKIRYYYTRENDKVQKFVCDWSNAGTETVTGTFHSLESPKDGADTYFEIGFTKEAGYIGIGADIFINFRIHKEDFSRYDLTNDFSLQKEERYMEWEKVDVFVGAEKVWGIGVLPSEGEEEEGRMEYANTAYQPVRAEMYNYHKKEASNTIAPRFRVYNTGTKDFRLSDLRINYFYTTDDEQEQMFEADHVGIGGNYEPFISSKDVTSEFSEVGEENLETYCIADIGFTREDVWVEPGEYVELNVRIHRPDWSKLCAE